jgi:hypothetical protein
VYPCKNALPDISLNVGGRMITVPGINMNYQSLSILTCFGGIQRADRMPFSIFGDVFLKGLFAAFEHPRGSAGARIGFAHMPRTNDVLLPGATNAQQASNEGNSASPPPPADSDDDDDDDNDSQRLSAVGPRIPAIGRPAGQWTG